jgi:hypothetical protein
MRWLGKHWIAATGLFISGLYVYLQLLQWEKHGDDFMLIAANIVVTAVLWLILLILILRNLRKPSDQRRRSASFYDDDPHYQTVRDHKFRNQTVELDGKRFEDCEFENATLMFNGNAPTEILDPAFSGTLQIGSHDPAINQFVTISELIRSVPQVAKFDCVLVDTAGHEKKKISSWTRIQFRPRREDEANKEATKPKEDHLCNALKAIANKDSEKLNDRIQQISQRIEFHFGHGADPSLDVITELWNGSVFDLVNFGEISGHATYASRQLAGDPRIIDSVEPIILNLRHGQKVTFTVRQYLSIEMADSMQANRDRQIAIDFENIAVTFKMAPFPEFSNQSFRWFGPRFAIEDTVRV